MPMHTHTPQRSLFITTTTQRTKYVGQQPPQTPPVFVLSEGERRNLPITTTHKLTNKENFEKLKTLDQSDNWRQRHLEVNDPMFTNRLSL